MTTNVAVLIPEIDTDFLAQKSFRYDLCPEGGAVCVIIQGYQMPPTYLPSQVDLLIQLPAGYPNAKPDMFWTRPDVKLVGGSWPRSSDVHEIKCGQSWQRWSRHFPDNRWRPGTDNLRTYLASIRAELLKGV